MPLPAAAATRRLKHRRQIEVQVFVRDDGLWEADATLSDVKTRDTPLAGGLRAAGQPIHDMLLRVVVDTRLDIVAAGSHTRAMPYPGQCDRYAAAPGEAAAPEADPYTRLAGLNLLQDFRRALRQRVGGVLGCTHLTELAQVLPTAVVQAMAGEVIDTRGQGDAPPFQIDRCHALRAEGEVVRLHHPRWHRAAAAAAADAGTAPRQQAASYGVHHARRPDAELPAAPAHPEQAAAPPAHIPTEEHR